MYMRVHKKGDSVTLREQVLFKKECPRNGTTAKLEESELCRAFSGEAVALIAQMDHVIILVDIEKALFSPC